MGDAGLFTECESRKRVSFFVETILSTLKTYHGTYYGAMVPRPPRITKYSTRSLDCTNMPIDIERYISHLVPFEFARRGIHATIEKCVPSPDLESVVLSKISPCFFQYDGEVPTSGVTKAHDPGVVTGVYLLGANQKSPFNFSHGGHPYRLSWPPPGAEGEVIVSQLDAGC